MAIIWADFPGGQRGLYGQNESHMLNGVYAEVRNDPILSQDPDPNIGAEAVVLFTNGTATTSEGLRFVLPAEVTTLGVGVRLWMDQLPTHPDNSPYIDFRDNTNTSIILMRISTTGQVVTAYGSSGPVLTANAYNHIEVKATKGAGTGAIAIRVNGAEVLNLTALALSANNIAQFFFGSTANTSGALVGAYWKDLIVWDTSGSEANDWQGSVAVYDLYADADVSLNWTPSVGALGYPLITDDFPSNVLTVSGLIIDGTVVRIDNTYYRLSSGSLDSGAPAGTSGNPWRVLIGVDNAATMLNLFNAIGATGVAGTDYSTALTAHTTVDANGVTDTQVSVEAKLQSASAIVTTETGANLAWTAGTLTGGPTDPSYIEAPDPPPSPAVFTLTNLPPDVTSVRALIPIFRSQKTDGGDCNVQAGLSPDNATWVNTADVPQTVAFTFYWSPIHTDPVTGLPWSPAAVNGAYVRVDRTL